MRFPNPLGVFVRPGSVLNVTETGEVTKTKTVELDFIKLLTKGLACSYKAYSMDLSDDINGHLYLGDLPISEEYYEYMSYPYASTDLTFAVEKPDFAVQTFAFLKPFTLNVWIGLLLCVIFASLMHLFVFWRRISLVSAFFYIVGTLFGKHHDWRPKSLAEKLLVLSWIVGVMFMNFSYVSVLLSFLTVPVREKGITDVGDLFEAVWQKKATAVNFVGMGQEYVMLRSDNEKLRYLGEHIAEQTKVTNENAYQRIKTNAAIIGPRTTLSAFFAVDKYFISEDSISLTYYSMLDWTDDGFCCMERVNEVIHWIWSAGFNKKLYDDFTYKQRLGTIFKYQHLMTVQDPIRPLGLKDLSGAFYFLITGLILGLICFICEVLAQHCS